MAPACAPHTGHWLGKGIYLADVAAKSAAYCAVEPSDAPPRRGVLLLVEAAVGAPARRFVTAHAKVVETLKAKLNAEIR